MFKKIWKFLNRDIIDVYQELFKKEKKIKVEKIMENSKVSADNIISELDKILKEKNIFESIKNRKSNDITKNLGTIEEIKEKVETLSIEEKEKIKLSESFKKCQNSVANVEKGYKTKLTKAWKSLETVLKIPKQEEAIVKNDVSSQLEKTENIPPRVVAKPQVDNKDIQKKLNIIEKQLEEIKKDNSLLKEKSINPIGHNTLSIIDKLKTFKIPSLQEIKKLFTDSNQKLEISISNISNSMPKDYSNKKDITVSKEEIKRELQSEISKISNKIKTTQTKTIEDITFNTNNKFEELNFLKELGEDLESVPADIKKLDSKLLSIDEKLDGLSLKKSKNKVIIPNKKVIDDLSTYMEDGLKHLVNISKTHVAQSEELEEFKKEKGEYENKLQKIKEETTQRVKEETEKEINIKIIKKIVEDFPSKFEEIKSVFNDYLSKEFEVDEELNVTNDNKNELSNKIRQPLDINIKYKIIKSAILLENEVLIKAEVKEIKEDKNQEEAVTNG